MIADFSSWILGVLSSVAAIVATLAIPGIRETIGRYVAGFVQHHFEERIEKLRSELRLSEAKFSAGLRESERQLESLTTTALSIRSSRQTALEARRLQAVERIWAVKIASDRMKLGARIVSGLNLEEIEKAASRGDPKVRPFVEALDKMTGVDLEKQPLDLSAQTERLFVPPEVWALFAAYQGVMVHSLLRLKALRFGAAEFMNKDDALKSLMLLALPEQKPYIEKYGFSSYYHLLDTLEERLLASLVAMLEGRDLDAATLKRTAEIISASHELHVDERSKIPESFRGPEIPAPPKV